MPKIMKHLNSISRMQALYRAARVTNINGYHHPFVYAVCEAPGRAQEELARQLCLNKSTVARTLAQLEADGYITRRQNPDDKREYLVYPTDAMQALLPVVRGISADWNTAIAAGISDTELATFYAVLTRMEQNARTLIYNEEDTRA